MSNKEIQDFNEKLRRGLELAEKKQPQRVAVVPRKGWAAAARKAHAAGEDKLMIADVFEDEKMEDLQW